MVAAVRCERWALLVSGWVCGHEVAVAWYELLAGGEVEGSPVVEECLEFAGWVELLGVCPGVESVDVDAG
jgi:hypothetical protein